MHFEHAPVGDFDLKEHMVRNPLIRFLAAM